MKALATIFTAMIFITGCSTLDTSAPAFSHALDAQGKVHALATQVRGAERISQADKVRSGERFFANCETYARTVADLLVKDGAEDVWLVTVQTKPGYGWVRENGRWSRDTGERHMVVEYAGHVIDNRWRAVLTWDDLKFEYREISRELVQ